MYTLCTSKCRAARAIQVACQGRCAEPGGGCRLVRHRRGLGQNATDRSRPDAAAHGMISSPKSNWHTCRLGPGARAQVPASLSPSQASTQAHTRTSWRYRRRFGGRCYGDAESRAPRAATFKFARNTQVTGLSGKVVQIVRFCL